MTDAYQPIERKLELTRRCLAVLSDFRQAVSVITKNRLVTRDVDLLGELARHNAAGVFVSVTSLDDDLVGRLEPRTTRPSGRLAAISALAAAGIPVGVMVAPIIPGLTEHEMPSILKAAAQAGARWAGYTIVRLPMAVSGLFQDWLEQHFPGRKEKVLERIRAMRDGRLNDSRFGVRMSGEGRIAEMVHRVFKVQCGQLGINQRPWPVSAEAFRRPATRARESSFSFSSERHGSAPLRRGNRRPRFCEVFAAIGKLPLAGLAKMIKVPALQVRHRLSSPGNLIAYTHRFSST